jgi:type II secretory pathway pseudopilin PulG
MFVRNKRWTAFTLAELILVVVMLALLAAIVIPRVAGGREQAGESATKDNLRVLRTAIAHYQAQHGGTFPGAAAAGDGAEAGTGAAFVSQLTRYTDASGETSDTKDATHVYGPYLKTGFPACTVGSISGKSDVKVVGVDSLVPDKSTGWLFSTVSGRIIPNTDELASDDTAFRNW